MSMIRWDPIGDLARMRREMDRIMNEFSREGGDGAEWLPAMDICDTNEALNIKMDLPGLTRENVEITTTEKMIRIKGRTNREEHAEGGRCYRHERMVGTFERAVSLPVRVRPEEARASFRDGVLEITLPKAEKETTQERRIEVQGD